VGAQLAGAGADQQDALAGDVQDHQRPGPLDLVGPAGADPLAVEDPLPLAPVHGVVEVVGGGQRPREPGHAGPLSLELV
jgi:hypothetical protein